jgi:hypothetical protein
MISEFCDKRSILHSRQKEEPLKPIESGPSYKQLTLDEKKEHKRQFGEAVMKYWSKSRGFINQEKFQDKMKGFDYVPSQALIDQFYLQVLDQPQVAADAESGSVQDKDQMKRLAISRTVFGDWNRKITQEMFEYIKRQSKS